MLRAIGSAFAALALVAGAASADITTGLIAHYPLNGNLLDQSGNGNNGTMVGTLVPAQDHYGNAGGAYEFDGTSSYVLIPSSPSLSSPTNAITMSCWAMVYGYSKVGTQFDPILMKSNTTENAFMYRMLAYPGGFGAAYGNWNTDVNSSRVSATGWNFLATTFDGAKMRFYSNGVCLDSSALSYTMAADTRPLTIGADTPGILEIFWGRLSDVRIYNRVLTPADIQELYGVPSGVGDEAATAALAFRSVVPNPMRGSARLEFDLAAAGPVELSIVDVAGRSVREIERTTLPAGPHAVAWDGRDEGGAEVAAGLYFARLRAAGREITRRVARIR